MQSLPLCSPALVRRFILTLVVLSLAISCVSTARATVVVSPGVNLNQILAQLTTLQNQVNTLQNTVNTQATTINNLKAVVGTQAATITALQAKTAPLSIKNGVGTNTELFITGVNVHVVSGSGFTDDGINGEILDATKLLGLGNLIIGYDEPMKGTVTATGSHNLIVGDENSYTSFGGVVFGFTNTNSGAYSSIVGGSDGVTGGLAASIAGGFGNQALAGDSSVLGGSGNVTNGGSILGGENNVVNSVDGTVSGGSGNVVNGNEGAIAGGQNNLIDIPATNGAIAGSNNQEINTPDGFLP